MVMKSQPKSADHFLQPAACRPRLTIREEAQDTFAVEAL